MRLARLGILFGYLVLVLGTAALALARDRRPYAPLSVLPRPAAIRLGIVYSPEARAWLEAAARAFEAGGAQVEGAPIDVELQPRPARDAASAIASGALQPAAWLPSSQASIDWLAQLLPQGDGGMSVAAGEDAPRSLATSPVVIVMWQERAAALGIDSGNAWQLLHEASTKPDGWAAYNHPEWGVLKWGQANPRLSDSGLLVLLQMAYARQGKATMLESAAVGDDGFVRWLAETQATAGFGDDGDRLMNDMLAFGASRYDAIATYEHLAVQYLPDATRRGHTLQVIYPEPTVVGDYPFAMLDGNNITDRQRAAARLFRAFLLSNDQQVRLLKLGLRPAPGGLSVAAAGSPLAVNSTAGLQTDLPPAAPIPNPQVFDALVAAWTRSTGR